MRRTSWGPSPGTAAAAADAEKVPDVDDLRLVAADGEPGAGADDNNDDPPGCWLAERKRLGTVAG
jgi:hypothetical protein